MQRWPHANAGFLIGFDAPWDEDVDSSSILGMLTVGLHEIGNSALSGPVGQTLVLPNGDATRH